MSQYTLPENLKMTHGAAFIYEKLVDGSLTLKQAKRKKGYLRSVYQEQNLIDMVVAIELYKFKTDGLLNY